MKFTRWLMFVLLLPIIAQAETYKMTLKADPPLKDVSGNTLEPKDIIGYKYYVSLDVPFANLSEFTGDPIVKDVVWDLASGDIVDDATELVLTYDFPDEPSSHTVYATIVVRGRGGLDSVPFMPVIAPAWEVVDAPRVAPNPPINLRVIDRVCSAKSWRWICNILNL